MSCGFPTGSHGIPVGCHALPTVYRGETHGPMTSQRVYHVWSSGVPVGALGISRGIPYGNPLCVPRNADGTPMAPWDIPWYPHGIPHWDPLGSHWVTMGSPWDRNWTPWGPHGVSMGSPWWPHGPMGSHDIIGEAHRPPTGPHGIPIGIPMVPLVSPMVSPWVPRGITMGSP